MIKVAFGVGLGVLAALAGLIVNEALIPALIIDTNPQQCTSRFGYDVPCWEGFPFGAGLATFVVVGLLFWFVTRRINTGKKW
jgi:hypothetical protein